jgi:hypothetical protein
MASTSSGRPMEMRWSKLMRSAPSVQERFSQCFLFRLVHRLDISSLSGQRPAARNASTARTNGSGSS